MTGAKDMAGISFFFTAGAAAGLALYAFVARPGSDPSSGYLLASASFILCLSAMALISLSRRKTPARIFLLYSALGIFCANASEVSGLGLHGRETWFTAFAVTSADRVRELIDSIPFSSDDSAQLIKALLTGDKSGLDKQIIKSFRDSGAAHILALSGLHLGIIYMILLWATSVLGSSPRAKIVRGTTIIVISGYYTIATGAAPSLTRAFLFIVLNESAKLLHRKIPPLRVFCTALLIQTACNPEVLRSVGFQLSYLAMAGIFILFPVLKAWFPAGGSGWNIARKIWNAAALTISCQIFTAPLVWYRFRSFPLYFLITNILAIPITEAVMITATATVILSGTGLCPAFLVTVTDWTTSALIFIMEVISGL